MALVVKPRISQPNSYAACRSPFERVINTKLTLLIKRSKQLDVRVYKLHANCMLRYKLYGLHDKVCVPCRGRPHALGFTLASSMGREPCLHAPGRRACEPHALLHLQLPLRLRF